MLCHVLNRQLVKNQPYRRLHKCLCRGSDQIAGAPKNDAKFFEAY